MQPQGFGARVKDLRQEKGWPQPRLADAGAGDRAKRAARAADEAGA